MEIKAPLSVDILSLGCGWTGTFLLPEMMAQNISFTSTSRDGSHNTIPFTFDPESNDTRPYARLPQAETVVIIFPLVFPGAHETLIRLYNLTHSKSSRWIQLGSSSAFEHDPGEEALQPLWRDRHSKVDTAKPRVQTEEELLALSQISACVLNLAGLWGGSRDPRNYVKRLAPTKAALSSRGSLHMIHGVDVARCIAAVHRNFLPGRFLLTDMRVYDWWSLLAKRAQ